MSRQSKPDRRLLFTILTVIILLYGLYMLFSDNNRKYQAALHAASTAIERNNQAIRDEWATYDAATHQAIATGLPMTLTRIVVTISSTPAP
jgi:sulfite exporter TauE/SafE